MPILADSAEDALDFLFGRQIIDPVTQPRERAVTKHGVLHAIRLSYFNARIDPNLVRRKAELFVGDHVHTTLDYAIANGITVQLSQGWSFQGAQVDAVSEQVKAWAYALTGLREGMESRLVNIDESVADVSPAVDLQIVVAPPITTEQEQVYREAQQVFRKLNASVHDFRDVNEVGRRAAKLLQKNDHP